MRLYLKPYFGNKTYNLSIGCICCYFLVCLFFSRWHSGIAQNYLSIFFVAVKAEIHFFQSIPEKLNPIHYVLFIGDHTNDILVTTSRVGPVSLLTLFCVMKVLYYFFFFCYFLHLQYLLLKSELSLAEVNILLLIHLEGLEYSFNVITAKTFP